MSIHEAGRGPDCTLHTILRDSAPLQCPKSGILWMNSIINSWKRLRHVNSWALPRPVESEIPGVGPKNLNFNKACR